MGCMDCGSGWLAGKVENKRFVGSPGCVTFCKSVRGLNARYQDREHDRTTWADDGSVMTKAT